MKRKTNGRTSQGSTGILRRFRIWPDPAYDSSGISNKEFDSNSQESGNVQPGEGGAAQGANYSPDAIDREVANSTLGALTEQWERQSIQLKGLLDQLEERPFCVVRDGHYSYVSDPLAQALGYRPEEMLGRPWSEFIHPEDLGKSLEMQESVFNPRPMHDGVDNRMRTKTGSYVHVRWFADFIFGSIVCIAAIN